MWTFSTGKRATTSNECTVAKNKLDGYALARFATNSLRLTFEELRGLPMFVNGRDVVQIWAAVVDCRAQRVRGSPEIAKTIAYWGAGGEGARRIVLAGRKPVPGAVVVGGYLDERDEADQQVKNQRNKVERDEGVNDATWVRLERAKHDEEAKLQNLKEAAEQQSRELQREQERGRSETKSSPGCYRPASEGRCGGRTGEDQGHARERSQAAGYGGSCPIRSAGEREEES